MKVGTLPNRPQVKTLARRQTCNFSSDGEYNVSKYHFHRSNKITADRVAKKKHKCNLKWTPSVLRQRIRDGSKLDPKEWCDFKLDERIEQDRHRAYYKPHPLPPAISINYPFFGTAGDELLTFIMELIGDRMCSWDTKAEVAQEMALAILAGIYSREQLAADVDSFISKKFRKFAIGLNHTIVSLDALMDEDGEVTLHDAISIKDSMTQLDAAMNYETRGTRYERPEQWDGEIVGRY